MQLVYLACPYTNPALEVRRGRVALADIFTARLMRQHAVFSPISQGPRVEPYLKPSQAKSHRFWMEQCIPILRNSTACYVLPIEGWRESKGVSEEIALAIQMHIPVIIIQAHDQAIELIDIEELRATGWRTEWYEADGFKGARK